jgi:hypothetical protein
MADMAQKGRAQRYNSKKTHCPAGHAYAEYAVPTPTGSRQCRICNLERANSRRRSNPERARAMERKRYWAKKETASNVE